MEKRFRVGIIGFGNMGTALGFALKKGKIGRIYVYDKDEQKTRGIKGFYLCKSSEDVIKQAEIVVLAVKPQDIKEFVEKTKDCFLKYKPLVISICAGISTGFFERLIERVRIIRVMPNLPAKVGQSLSFLSRGDFSQKKDIEIALKIFSYVGQTIEIEEDYLDKVTSISGSGPGYIYYFMDNLYDCAVSLGFNREVAEKMTKQVLIGAAELIKAEGDDFKTWIKRVASSGGTTQAAIDVLEEHKFRNLIEKAVKSAYSRAKQLNVG